MNFFELFREEFGVSRTEKFLQKMDNTIPWDLLEKKLWDKRIRGKNGVGRPFQNATKMIKSMFLQGLYGLSDPELEDQLRDRMSFQKFVGISSEKDIPDDTTFCRFRNELVEMGFQEDIFSLTQELLHTMGITVEKGHIQDATFFEQAKGKKNKYGDSTRDPDATFTKKGGETHHGYKGHIETNSTHPYILNSTFTTAKVHDSQQQNALMSGEETCAYGDSAYGSSDKKNQSYNDCGVETQFNQSARRNNPLTPLQKAQNRIKSIIRAKVEHPFAWIKNRYMHTKVRYRGLTKNSMHWFFISAVYNFDLLARKYG